MWCYLADMNGIPNIEYVIFQNKFVPGGKRDDWGFNVITSGGHFMMARAPSQYKDVVLPV